MEQQRRNDPSGDYEYDMAHEVDPQQRSGPRPEQPHAPAPSPRTVEYDTDMSYDEAHDFR